MKIDNLDFIKEYDNNICKYNSVINLSQEDKIIIGYKNILSTFLLLLENAIKLKHISHDTIYISFSTDTSFLDDKPDFERFKEVLSKVIKNNWKITLLFKINDNLNRTLKFVKFFSTLIATGNFLIYYYKKYDVLTSDKEAIIIPGIGALSCYSTTPDSLADFGFYINNDIGVKFLKDYFHGLLSKIATPLTRHYSINEGFEFSHSLIENEEGIGKRFLYKNSFSTLTLPISVYKKLLTKINLSINKQSECIKLFKRRANAFLLNLQNYEHIDIYSLNTIQNLIRNKQILFNSPYGAYTIDLENEVIISHLENIIYLLKTYYNYKIAFIKQNTLNDMDNIKFNCWIKEKYGVNIEVLEKPKNISKIKISIEEPMVINAFELYFKEIWENIAPINKDKNSIIKWLEDQVSILNRSNNYTKFKK